MEGLNSNIFSALKNFKKNILLYYNMLCDY